MKLSLLILALPLSLAADTVYTTYTDQSAFLAAIQDIPNTTTELETFSESTLTAPGLSVATWGRWAQPHYGFGSIVDGVWNDCVGRDCGITPDSRTTWSFAYPTYAFGATFDYEVWQFYAGSIGLSFDFNHVNPPIRNGFFGFTSSEPMSSLLVTQNAWKDFPPDFMQTILMQQYYTMDNLYFAEDAPAPEPSTWALLGIGALLVWWGTKRGTKTASRTNKTSK